MKRASDDRPKLLSLNPGISLERSFLVTAEHAIPFADEAMPAVLSTPALIAEVERTAREAVASQLLPNERTVGTSLDIEHLAATPVGATVRTMARLIAVDGKRLTFAIEARDHFETLLRGVHRRYRIDVAKLRRRLDRKRPEST